MRIRTDISFLVAWCILQLASLPVAADSNWPQFRGPSGRGISEEVLPQTWNLERGENVRWQTPIPGLGHASPIIWSNRVYVATAVRPGAKSELKTGIYGAGESYVEKEPHQWRLLCLDLADGTVLWDQLAHEAVPRQQRHTKASHCNSTPATDGQHLVAILGSEGLFGFDLEGRRIWRRDLGKMDAGPWDVPDLQWSFASSPILYDGRVFVQCDVLSEQFLAAYDVTDGREVWRTPRKEVANWCTPALALNEGQIVLNGWKEVAGYDLKNGKRLWWLGGGGDIPVPAPLVVDGMAFFTSAHGKYRPLRAVRLDARGDVTPPRVEDTNAAVVWCHPRLGSYMQTPIVIGSNLWSCDWQGVLTCGDASTGKLHYSERLGTGGQGFTASPIAAKGRLYFADEGGRVYVVAAQEKFEVLATNQLGDACLATPAASGGTLLFRTPEKVVAFSAKP
ncbi:MAG TPA: PQQ-binding-like beta-propeller repeat protein [Verrucomicrobiota bacterium]|nr:PQQ-binding-like beta-propeller repeat protein [Verrucomicrobiota bacterium]